MSRGISLRKLWRDPRGRKTREACAEASEMERLSNEDARDITEREQRESEINTSTRRSRHPGCFLP